LKNPSERKGFSVLEKFRRQSSPSERLPHASVLGKEMGFGFDDITKGRRRNESHFLSCELFASSGSLSDGGGTLFFSKTHEVFLETPIPAGLRFNALQLGKSGFRGKHELVDVFSDENLQYEMPAPL
jgi:hypothetical protein